MQNPVLMYGVGNPVMAYMAPDPQPFQPVPAPQVGGTIVIPQVKKPELNIEESVKALKDEGLDGINALRLLAICEWYGEIALAIFKECGKSQSIRGMLKTAHDIMTKEVLK